MASLSFIIRLRRSFEAFEKEYDRAEMQSPEYFRYLHNLSFASFIEQVISACAMFPRSMDACQDNLRDLSYGIINELGIGADRLSAHDSSSLARLVFDAGIEVLGQLEGNGYFLRPSSFPRGWQDDPNFETDLSAVSIIKKVNRFTFQVSTEEYHFDDVGSDSISMLKNLKARSSYA